MLTALLPAAGWRAPSLSSPALARDAGQAGPRLARDRAAAPDATLLRWSAEGDRLAFDQLAVRHLPRLHAIALRITGRAAEAEEVAQEAMLRAWQQAARFDPDRAQVGTWLYRIAANLAIDRVRRAGAAPLDEVAEAVADPQPGPEEVLATKQRDARLAAALAGLPARQRAAIALAYDQGMSGAEAAAALSVSTRALEGLLRRARQLLSARLHGTGQKGSGQEG
ncbi:sigma-70 family RNA polymerase sigma factor [Roseomonas sp. OT10]|uniref:sigma-70 family RNA polymerase sigma factor n=1 Tax=Roseomonas cutis TaxID=2897332 RepID=UPI001E49E829|nr:sigma-70 family RNA polymerase sigma factor [Roseomonas sp. OT10]UFN47841.1 sigma-70 family RNA polymerase sigma factor [Roseomonas sp. OT10]